MKYSVLGSFLGSVWVVLSVGCGGQSGGDDTGTTNANPREAGTETVGEAGLAVTDDGSESAPQPVEAAVPASSADAGSAPMDAGTTPVPVPTTVPTAPPTTLPTATATSTTPTVMIPTAPEPTTDPIEEPVPSMPLFDWSQLKAPEGCQIEAAFGTDDEQCFLNVVCDGIYEVFATCSPALGYSCSCQDDDNVRYLNVEGGDLFEVCQASVDFCHAPSSEDFAAASCEAANGGADATSCYAGHSCKRATQFESGVTVSNQYDEHAECAFDPDSIAGENGEWQCTCARDGNATATFYTPGLSPTLDTCTHARDLCDRFDQLVAGEGTICDSAFESFNETYCDSAATCLVAGTIDGQLVHVNDDLLVNCIAATDEAWVCNVDGPFGPSIVTIPPPEQPLDACRGIASDVLEQLDSQGPGSEPDQDAGVAVQADAG